MNADDVELEDSRGLGTISIASYNVSDAEAIGARGAAVELGRELVEATELTPDAVEVSEDQFEPGCYSLRFLTPSTQVGADVLEELGAQGFAIEYLGERSTTPRSYVWLIETEGDVHGGLY